MGLYPEFMRLQENGQTKSVKGAIFVKLILALTTAAILILFPAISSNAVVSPSSGPASGGTNVTVDGIKFVKVSVGIRHALGLTSQGTVFAWGYNSAGELGDGTTSNRSIPVQVKGIGGTGYLTGVTDISAGGWFSLAVSNGELVSWGENGSGTLGNASNTNSSVPVFVTGVGGTGHLTGITSISAGFAHALASDGNNVYSWGSNYLGQLGNNNSGVDSNMPVRVVGLDGTSILSGATTVTAGAHTGFAVVGNFVYAWGNNTQGEVGDNTTTTRSYPVRVVGPGGTGLLTGMSMLTAGESFTVASSGAATYAWGNNSMGALGDGTVNNSNFPVQVLGIGGTSHLAGVTALGAGLYQALAVTSNGAVAWGSNIDGTLGNNSTTDSLFPVRVLGLNGLGHLTNATSIDGGEYYSMASTPDGIFGWGDSSNYFFGDGGTLNDSLVPILGPNFQPAQLLFGSLAAQSLANIAGVWSAVSPAGSVGTISLGATANLFGGTTPGSPTSATWDAGTFTYEAALAKTGTPNNAPLLVASGIAVLVGAGLLIALRRQNWK